MRLLRDNNLKAGRDNREVCVHHGEGPVARIKDGNALNSDTHLLAPCTHIPDNDQGVVIDYKVKVIHLMRQESFLMPVVIAITKSILSFQTVVLGGKYIIALSGVKNIV